MRKTLLLAVAVFTGATVAVFEAQVAHCEPFVTPQAAEPVAVGQVPDPKREALTNWIHTMMTTLAKEKHDDDFWKEIATDIAIVSLSESPDSPAKAASALTSLAFHEGRFREYVDKGLCNDRQWRKSKEGKQLMLRGGDCDGGYAHSLWQIHPLEVRTTVEAVRDRRTAARVAWNIIKSHGWCAYSGEGGNCPKAEARRLVAANYLSRHPIVLP